MKRPVLGHLPLPTELERAFLLSPLYFLFPVSRARLKLSRKNLCPPRVDLGDFVPRMRTAPLFYKLDTYGVGLWMALTYREIMEKQIVSYGQSVFNQLRSYTPSPPPLNPFSSFSRLTYRVENIAHIFLPSPCSRIKSKEKFYNSIRIRGIFQFHAPLPGESSLRMFEFVCVWVIFYDGFQTSIVSFESLKNYVRSNYLTLPLSSLSAVTHII